MPRLNEHRRAQRVVAVCQLQQVAVLDIQLMSIGGTDDGGVVPGELGDRLGQLLQPTVVGEATIIDGGIGPEDHFPLALQLPLLRGMGQVRGMDGRGLRRKRRLGDHAVMYRAAPPGLEIRALVLPRPISLDDVVGARLRAIGEDLQHLVG